MSLAYPIARTLEDAARPGVKFARSRREAADLFPGLVIEGLETGWLHLTEAEAIALFSAQGAGGPAGHLQRYEDTSGHVVVAISWWKVADPNALPGQNSSAASPAQTMHAMSEETDDLYFRRGRTRPRRRKPSDPNQLDLFGPETR
jgi:hypothetical protein